MPKSNSQKNASELDSVAVCVIVPVFNEQSCLLAFNQRVTSILESLHISFQILYVDDGSCDESFLILRTLQASDSRIAIIKFARNFGKENAMSAGLDFANADAVILIDADLQDPPELIEKFWQEFQQGTDVVYGVRSQRDGESWLKRFSAAAFYRVIEKLSDTPIPRDTGDFRLMSRRAVEAMKQLRERQRFMKGLFSWVGFHQKPIVYARDARYAGKSKFNFWRLWNFALEGITSFSTAPLRIATYLGIFSAVFAFAMGAWIVSKTLLFGEPVRGYPSLMSVVLFLGGTQLIALGLIGEYLGRLYMESKQRPLYLIDEIVKTTTTQNPTYSTKPPANEIT